jgi:heme oxygenase
VLREQTQLIHRRVEAQLALLDPVLSVERLTRIVERFYGFWAGNEAAIEVWAMADPEAAAALCLSRRQRAGLFEHDLVTLGMSRADVSKTPRASPVFHRFGPEEVFGWLYVTEGSTLGGAMIDRQLRQVGAFAGLDLG